MKYLLLIVLLCAGCVTLSPEKKQYIASTADAPLRFRISHDSTEVVMKRATAFLIGYCRCKLTRITDSLLQTREPNEMMGEYGYRITVSNEPDSATVGVVCTASSTVWVSNDNNAQRNAHIAARYLRNGDLPYPELIYR